VRQRHEVVENMSPTNPATTIPRALSWPWTVADRLKEIGMFFNGTDPVHVTMRRVAERLEQAGISYAIVGGMAVNAHGHRRTTGDVDLLVTAEGFDSFLKLLASGDFERVPGRARRFLDRVTAVTFDLLITGRFPGSGRPGPIAFPDPAAVKQQIGNLPYVDLTTLIQLKLAARRHKDFGDVVELIRTHGLDESFADKLHPSVRGDYTECLEEKRREDEYEAREDEAVDEGRRGGGEKPS
jgi:hypothetical protein